MATLYRYRPATSRARLSKEARQVGRKSMEEFLLSDDVLRPVMQATKDIEEAAKALTIAEGAVDSGEFLNSFESFVGDYLEVGGNTRVTGRIANNSAHAAALEFGNQPAAGIRRPARRILGRAGQPWHTEKIDL